MTEQSAETVPHEADRSRRAILGLRNQVIVNDAMSSLYDLLHLVRSGHSYEDYDESAAVFGRAQKGYDALADLWQTEPINGGLDDERTGGILVTMDYKSLLQRYLLHVGELEGTTFLGRHLDNNSDFTDDEREALRALVAS